MSYDFSLQIKKMSVKCIRIQYDFYKTVKIERRTRIENGVNLEEAADDIKNNRVYNAREVFEELDRKYGYKVWSYINNSSKDGAK